MLTVGSLFSGIGGLDLGLEQAGMKTVWQVEFDDWARGKLEENFPHTEKFKDVREVGKHNLRPVDLICGGFPCQDLSRLLPPGREGLNGKRSGLWEEYHRIIRELRPRYVLIENVAALIGDGLDRLLSHLAGLGYDAEWETLRAESFGLATPRKRLFVVAVATGIGRVQGEIFKRECFERMLAAEGRNFTPKRIEAIGHTTIEVPERLRVDNGVPYELPEIAHALKGYGNAVCPPVAKWIGERIIEFNDTQKEGQ